MTAVYLGLGSNQEREHNLARAVRLLQARFGALVCSPVYESEPLSGVGQPYFNLCASLETTLPVTELKAVLREIEQTCGRVRDDSGGCCALDVDILLVDDRHGGGDGVTLPHPDVLRRAFVLQPLCDLVPDLVHPLQQKTLRQLWQSFPDACSLRRVSLDLPG